METFCLIDAGKHMAAWCILTTHREGGLVWMDFKHRMVPFDQGKVLAHVSADNFHRAYEHMPEEAVEIEKMYAFRYLLDPWAYEGWLAPDGKFYGCGFYAHDDLAYSLLRKSPGMLESEGWVRVHSSSFMTGRDYGRQITRRQESSLEKLGFVEFEAPGRRSARYIPDRGTPPPRCAVQPPKGFVHPHDLEIILESAPTEADWLNRFVVRMKEYPVLAALFEAPHELIPDFGPGTWDWGIQWGDLYIGSEEAPDELLKAEGLRLVKTSGDTMEIISWPKPGLSAEYPEKRMLTFALRDAGQDVTLVDAIPGISFPLQRTA
ncbi:hypothetical protein G6L37_35100 [Agrobacterium rubi]|nr:hypothetical protein [Agrobacterium rubi]NTF23798.1 hypothetical protein [Agrobacterium rubi]